MTIPETIQAPAPIANLGGKISAVAVRQGLLIASGGAIVDRAANQDWIGCGIAVALATCVILFGWFHEWSQHRTLGEAVSAFWEVAKQ